MKGLNAVGRIVRDHGIAGVFGSILELLHCEEKLFTAVEVTAANRSQIMLPIYVDIYHGDLFICPFITLFIH